MYDTSVWHTIIGRNMTLNYKSICAPVAAMVGPPYTVTHECSFGSNIASLSFLSGMSLRTAFNFNHLRNTQMADFCLCIQYQSKVWMLRESVQMFDRYCTLVVSFCTFLICGEKIGIPPYSYCHPFGIEHHPCQLEQTACKVTHWSFHYFLLCSSEAVFYIFNVGWCCRLLQES